MMHYDAPTLCRLMQSEGGTALGYAMLDLVGSGRQMTVVYPRKRQMVTFSDVSDALNVLREMGWRPGVMERTV